MVHHKVIHLKKELRYFALYLEKKAIAILCKLHCTYYRTVLLRYYQWIIIYIITLRSVIRRRSGRLAECEMFHSTLQLFG